MSLLVQKFGGTSVADSNKILAAARRAIQAHQRGEQVLVVVSARGHTTDELIALAKEITETPPAREMDMLLATGEQVSVALDGDGHREPGRAGDQLHRGPDRPGDRQLSHQGPDPEHLHRADGPGPGRGQDRDRGRVSRASTRTTTSRPWAAAAPTRRPWPWPPCSGADGCEIYTDVDGVYTTDPRIVPEARKIDRISYDEMLELASLGAGVMHSRSIEFAKKYGVPIHVRSSFSDAPGTWIVDEHDARRLGVAVTGAALAKDEARITILGVPDRPGVVHAIFRTIAAANIVVDMIVQNVATGGDDRGQLHRRQGRPGRDAARRRGRGATRSARPGVTHDAEVAKVSVVGLGMRTHTGVATAMFEALAAAGINIQMITTSEIKISVLVDRAVGRAGAARRAPGVPARSTVARPAATRLRRPPHRRPGR